MGAKWKYKLEEEQLCQKNDFLVFEKNEVDSVTFRPSRLAVESGNMFKIIKAFAI